MDIKYLKFINYLVRNLVQFREGWGQANLSQITNFPYWLKPSWAMRLRWQVSLMQQRCLSSPAHSCTPIIPKMKKTKKQRRRTFPSMGSVSSSSITRILMPGNVRDLCQYQIFLCYTLLGILFIALSGLNTRTVLIAERLSFSTSRQYSRALKIIS